MNSRITAADIAAHLGLGKSTVAHVLNGRAEQLRISAATQARVHEAVRELGYRPNSFARAVGRGRFGSAALIQPMQGIYLPTGLLMGITDELQRNDMHLMVSETHGVDLSDDDFLPKVVREVAADGLLINMIQSIEPLLLETLHSLNTPAVWINNKQPVDAVHPDDLRAGRMATEHLVSLGHKSIAYAMSGDINRTDLHYSIYDRRRGYEDVMKKASLQPQTLALPPMPGTIEEIRADRRLDAALQTLSADSRPTALVAYSSDVALAFLQAAGQLGLRIPQDLSLVMFGDGPSHHICRPVTTACYNMGEVGRHAVRLLLKKIEEPSRVLPAIAVQPWFFQGNTSGPPG